MRKGSLRYATTAVPFSSKDLRRGDRSKWDYGLGFALIAAAAFFIFHKW